MAAPRADEDMPDSASGSASYELSGQHPPTTIIPEAAQASIAVDETIVPPLLPSIQDAINRYVATKNTFLTELAVPGQALGFIQQDDVTVLTLDQRLQGLFKLWHAEKYGLKWLETSMQQLELSDTDREAYDEADHMYGTGDEQSDTSRSASRVSRAPSPSTASSSDSDTDMERDDLPLGETNLEQLNRRARELGINNGDEIPAAGRIPVGAPTISNLKAESFPVPEPILRYIRLHQISVHATLIQIAQVKLNEKFTNNAYRPLVDSNGEMLRVGSLVYKMCFSVASRDAITWNKLRFHTVVDIFLDCVSTQLVKNAKAFFEEGSSKPMMQGDLAHGMRSVAELQLLQDQHQYPSRFISLLKELSQSVEEDNAQRYATAKRAMRACDTYNHWEWGMELVTVPRLAPTHADFATQGWFLDRINEINVLPPYILRNAVNPSADETTRLKFTYLVGRTLNPRVAEKGVNTLSLVLGRWAAYAALFHLHGAGLFVLLNNKMKDNIVGGHLGIKAAFFVAQALTRLDYLWPACRMACFKLMMPAVRNEPAKPTKLSNDEAYLRALRPGAGQSLVQLFLSSQADDEEQITEYEAAVDMVNSMETRVAQTLGRIPTNIVPELEEHDILHEAPNDADRENIMAYKVKEGERRNFFINNAVTLSTMGRPMAEAVATISTVYIQDDPIEGSQPGEEGSGSGQDALDDEIHDADGDME